MPHADAFLDMGLFGALTGTVPVHAPTGNASKVSRWSILREKIKAVVYREAKLEPRPTDCDFPYGVIEEADEPVTEEVLIPNLFPQDCLERLSQFESTAHALCQAVG